MSVSLLDRAAALTAADIRHLRIVRTWHIKKFRGSWAVPSDAGRVSLTLLNTLHYQGLLCIDWSKKYPEYALTALGRDILNLRGEAKQAAPSFQAQIRVDKLIEQLVAEVATLKTLARQILYPPR